MQGLNVKAQFEEGLYPREGLYELEEGKNHDYMERIKEQEEIKNFLSTAFSKAQINFDEYS